MNKFEERFLKHLLMARMMPNKSFKDYKVVNNHFNKLSDSDNK